MDDVRITADAYGDVHHQHASSGPGRRLPVTGLPASCAGGHAGHVHRHRGGCAWARRPPATAARRPSPARTRRRCCRPTATFTAGVASNVAVTFRRLGTQTDHRHGHGAPRPSPAAAAPRSPRAPRPAGLHRAALQHRGGRLHHPGGEGGPGGCVRQPRHHGHQQRHPRAGQQPGRRHAVRHHHGGDDRGRGHLQQPVPRQGGHGLHADGQLLGPHRRHQLGVQHHPGRGGEAGLPRPSPPTARRARPSPRRCRWPSLDAFGNPTTSTANVTIALGTNPAGGTLSGTTTVAAVNGVATFSDLSLTRRARATRWRPARGTLTGVDQHRVRHHPGRAVPGGHHPAAERHRRGRRHHPGRQGHAATTGTATWSTQATTPVSVSLGNNPSGGTLSGTTTVNAVSGVATFGNLSVRSRGLQLHPGGGRQRPLLGHQRGLRRRSRGRRRSWPSRAVALGQRDARARPSPPAVAVRDAAGNLRHGHDSTR